jgi:epoxyqueuosine reductase
LRGSSLTKWVAERASELGFVLSGVVRAEKFPELARQEEWLACGYGGEMKYLNDPRRSDPPQVMPGVRSVIVCALNYNTELPRTAEALVQASGSTDSSVSGPRGWISRYAWGDDYHEVLRGKLQELLDGLRAQCEEPFEARIYADTGPLHERVLAKHAGLGWLGKNTLLLNQQVGSYFFLGVILTTLDLPSSVGPAEAPPADRCGSCRACLDACPSGALPEPYVMDARKCISYLTIELRGTIPLELREVMGAHVYGCDICQDVCPWSRKAPITTAKEFQPRNFAALQPDSSDGAKESLFLPRLEWLASLSQQQFSELFRGSPIKRTKWRGLIRNVCIALGNTASADPGERARVVALLERLSTLEEPAIVESAQWAISRIQEMDRERATI